MIPLSWAYYICHVKNPCLMTHFIRLCYLSKGIVLVLFSDFLFIFTRAGWLGNMLDMLIENSEWRKSNKIKGSESVGWFFRSNRFRMFKKSTTEREPPKAGALWTRWEVWFQSYKGPVFFSDSLKYSRRMTTEVILAPEWRSFHRTRPRGRAWSDVS